MRVGGMAAGISAPQSAQHNCPRPARGARRAGPTAGRRRTARWRDPAAGRRAGAGAPGRARRGRTPSAASKTTHPGRPLGAARRRRLGGLLAGAADVMLARLQLLRALGAVAQLHAVAALAAAAPNIGRRAEVDLRAAAAGGGNAFSGPVATTVRGASGRDVRRRAQGGRPAAGTKSSRPLRRRAAPRRRLPPRGGQNSRSTHLQSPELGKRPIASRVRTPEPERVPLRPHLSLLALPPSLLVQPLRTPGPGMLRWLKEAFPR
jgi:hypothetical protein